MCQTLADLGYATVACNYTLSTPEAPSFPQAVIDVKNAIRWVKTEGVSGYGLRGPVVAAGSSAGGHLAMLAALSAGDPAFEVLSPPPGGYRVDAFAGLWGPTDLVWEVDTNGQNGPIAQLLGAPMDDSTRDLYAHASPLTHLDGCDPPGALFQCTGDATVPYQHAVMLHDGMAALGVYGELTLMEGGAHGFDPWGGLGPMAVRIAQAIPVLLQHATSADFNGDGSVNTLDVLAFLNAWGSGDPRGDFNGDGSINTLDVLAFLNAWGAGC